MITLIGISTINNQCFGNKSKVNNSDYVQSVYSLLNFNNQICRSRNMIEHNSKV